MPAYRFRPASSTYVTMGVVLLLGCLLTLGVHTVVSGWERKTLQLEFTVESEAVYADIRAAYRRVLLLHEAVHGLFVASDTVTRIEFRDFTLPLEQYFIGIQGVAWVPRVAHRQRPEYEQKLRMLGIDSPHFRELDEQGTLRKSRDRKYYYPLFYVEPLERRKSTIGFDVSSSHTRWEAMFQAATSGRAAASKRLTLVNEQGRSMGFLLVEPLFRKEGKEQASISSLRQIDGFILFAFRMKDFIDSALEDLRFKGVAAYVLDRSAPKGEQFLYGWLCDEATLEQATEGMHTRYTLEVGQRNWEIICAPLPEFYVRFETLYEWAASGGMVLLTILILIYTSASAQRTERIRQQVFKRTVELEQARNAAQEATRAKSEFLANMSHEVRTPLNAIIGLAEMVRKTGLTPKQTDYFSKIEGASRSLLGIVNDILDFSKIEAGKLVFDEAEMELAQVLWNILDMSIPRAANKGLQFHVITEAGLPSRVMGDALRFQQVLTNLVTNGIKFTDEGEVEVRVSPVFVGADTVRIRVQVSDTGIGISQGDQGRLFEAFTQADGSYTRQHGGTGLGLTISRQLVQLMNGDIGFESTPGIGSRFFFEVEFNAAQAMTLPTPRPQLRGRRALVVGPLNRDLPPVHDGLEAMGFTVSRAEDGAEALDRILEGAGFDLIWTGWRLASVNGLELARELRTRLSAGRLPYLVLATGNFTHDVRVMADQLFDAFVLQPVSMRAMARTVDRLFNIDPRAGELEEDPRDSVRGARVLVAEDNGINRQVIREILEDAGISVSMAVNGQEAVDMVRAAQEGDLDAVLMDIQMPVMDGLEATRVIRTLRSAEQLPVIAMTAHAMAEDRTRCMEAGMNDFVAKPLNVVEFFKVFSAWVEGREQDAEERRPVRPQTDQQVIPPLEGFDIQAGLERLGGKSSVYLRLLLEFLRDYADVIEIIRQLLHDEDQEHARQQVHTLKGVAGNIGAVDVHAACIELEQALKAGISCDDCLDSLAHAMRTALTSLGRYKMQVDAGEREQSCTTLFEDAEVAGKIRTLYALLEASDFKAVRAFAQIREYLACSEAAGAMAELETAINSFDFKGAAGHLKGVGAILGVNLTE